MLGKRPLWLQTSTHEVPLPSSNNPAPLLSLFTLFFFHDALYAACLLSILAVSTQNIVKGKNLRASLYPQKDPTYLYPTSQAQCLVGPLPIPYLFCVLGECTDDIYTVCFLALVGARGDPGRSPEQQESEVTAFIL